jgi:hypothetical protein
MMKKVQSYIAVFCVAGLLSCSQKLTSVYHYDNTKVDDGEITSTYLRGFFVQDKKVHLYTVRSNVLNQELQGIKDSITRRKPIYDFDDSYYGYAFVTAANDTLYADYNLAYWRYKEKGVFYANENLKSIIIKAAQ